MDYIKAWGAGRVQLLCACCLSKITLRALPIRHPELPPKCCPSQDPPAAGAWTSWGFSSGQLPLAAWDLQGWLWVWPQHILASCNPMDLSFNTTAATEIGLSLSWSHIFKQLGWSSASPISSSSRASAHAGISAPVAIRTPNCQAGIAVTNLSPCLYTPLSLCQIQQSLWDANAFTPTCFV